jgi:two-component system phosphate regulon sensor histidine kinase PhoR
MASERSVDSVTPRQVALGTAAFVAIVVGALAVWLVSRSNGAVAWWWAIAFALVAFVSVYVVMGVALERFITARLRVLFRMVHDLKTGRGEAPAVNLSADAIGEVERTMEVWAEEKRTEIAGLREREQYRREFIGNLAHEMKTPLHNMQGYLETLLDGGLEDPKVNRDFLQRGARSTDRLIKIV